MDRRHNNTPDFHRNPVLAVAEFFLRHIRGILIFFLARDTHTRFDDFIDWVSVQFPLTRIFQDSRDRLENSQFVECVNQYLEGLIQFSTRNNGRLLFVRTTLSPGDLEQPRNQGVHNRIEGVITERWRLLRDAYYESITDREAIIRDEELEPEDSTTLEVRMANLLNNSAVYTGPPRMIRMRNEEVGPSGRSSDSSSCDSSSGTDVAPPKTRQPPLYMARSQPLQELSPVKADPESLVGSTSDGREMVITFPPTFDESEDIVEIDSDVTIDLDNSVDENNEIQSITSLHQIISPELISLESPSTTVSCAPAISAALREPQELVMSSETSPESRETSTMNGLSVAEQMREAVLKKLLLDPPPSTNPASSSRRSISTSVSSIADAHTHSIMQKLLHPSSFQSSMYQPGTSASGSSRFIPFFEECEMISSTLSEENWDTSPVMSPDCFMETSLSMSTSSFHSHERHMPYMPRQPCAFEFTPAFEKSFHVNVTPEDLDPFVPRGEERRHTLSDMTHTGCYRLNDKIVGKCGLCVNDIYHNHETIRCTRCDTQYHVKCYAEHAIRKPFCKSCHAPLKTDRDPYV